MRRVPGPALSPGPPTASRPAAFSTSPQCEHVTCAVGEVAGRGEQPMLAAARLQPLQIDQPTGEVLRQRLLDREILVGRKEMTSDIAAALDRPSRTRLS